MTAGGTFPKEMSTLFLPCLWDTYYKKNVIPSLAQKKNNVGGSPALKKSSNLELIQSVVVSIYFECPASTPQNIF